MLALAWIWSASADDRFKDLSTRLGASLCAGIGGQAGGAEYNGLHLAYRLLCASSPVSRAWRPIELPSGRIVVFHGYFHNAAEIAAELGTDTQDLARLYGLAVEEWGDDAE